MKQISAVVLTQFCQRSIIGDFKAAQHLFKSQVDFLQCYTLLWVDTDGHEVSFMP